MRFEPGSEMGTLIRIAVRNLIQAKRRTLLLGTALAGVTALFILLLALSEGISDTMIRSATTLASGHVNVGGFFKTRSDDAAPVIRDVSNLRRIINDEIEGVEHIVDRVRGWARVVSPRGAIQAGITGVDIREEHRLLRTIQLAPEEDYLEGGRAEVFGDPSKLGQGAGALLFAGQARRLGVQIGDPLTIVAETLKGQRNSEEVTVVAIAEDIGFMSNFSLFVGKETLRRLYRLGPDVSGVIQIYLDNVHQAPRVMTQLRPVLEEAGYQLMAHEPKPFFAKFSDVAGEAWTGQKLDTTIWRDEVSFLTWILTAVSSVSVTLVIVLLLIIAVGMMNSMWISVRERTREIGTLRAIGMSRRRVLVMFVTEALILGAASTLGGAFAGSILAIGLDAMGLPITIEAVRAILMSDTLHLVVIPKHVAWAVAGFTAFSAFAALPPALRAARLQPVTAIHRIV